VQTLCSASLAQNRSGKTFLLHRQISRDSSCEIHLRLHLANKLSTPSLYYRLMRTKL
jgi:hypothetical protein